MITKCTTELGNRLIEAESELGNQGQLGQSFRSPNSYSPIYDRSGMCGENEGSLDEEECRQELRAGSQNRKRARQKSRGKGISAGRDKSRLQAGELASRSLAAFGASQA